MNNLKLVPAVKKLFCPNCGEDFISGPMGVPICPSCDTESKSTNDKTRLPFTNEKEFIQLVKSDLLRDDSKDPILRTPGLITLWKDTLVIILQEANERVGAINSELKRCVDESTKRQLSYSLTSEVRFRSKIKTRLFEADRLLGIERKPLQNQPKLPTIKVPKELQIEPLGDVGLTTQLENLKAQVKSLEGKVKQKENEISQIKTNYEALKNAASPDAIVFKETHNKLQAHTTRVEKQVSFFRYGLKLVRDYLMMGECNPEFILKIIAYRLESSNMEKEFEKQ